MLSIPLVFGINDLLALKDFNTFLNNYLIHEHPSLLHRWLAKRAQGWISRRALHVYGEIKLEVAKETINVALNDCPSGMFAVLALANDPVVNVKTGGELFLTIAATELAFNKIKKPREEQTYK